MKKILNGKPKQAKLLTNFACFGLQFRPIWSAISPILVFIVIHIGLFQHNYLATKPSVYGAKGRYTFCLGFLIGMFSRASLSATLSFIQNRSFGFLTAIQNRELQMTD